MTRVQADIAPAICDWLSPQIDDAAVLPAPLPFTSGDDYNTVVRMSVPPKWTPADGPLLIVADDGGRLLWPIKSRHTIRLTGWASGRTEARRIVSLAAGLLGSGRPPGVRSIDPDMGGVLDARDKATGAWLASVLIIAHARTIEV